jgi:hypothetical protein
MALSVHAFRTRFCHNSCNGKNFAFCPFHAALHHDTPNKPLFGIAIAQAISGSRGETRMQTQLGILALLMAHACMAVAGCALNIAIALGARIVAWSATF